jgi:hypothetical protein
MAVSNALRGSNSLFLAILDSTVYNLRRQARFLIGHGTLSVERATVTETLQFTFCLLPVVHEKVSTSLTEKTWNPVKQLANSSASPTRPAKTVWK